MLNSTELEKKGYNPDQINQILLAQKEGNKHILALPKNTSVENFRKFREITKKFKINTNDIAAIRLRLEDGLDINLIPMEQYIPDSYDLYFSILDQYGFETAAKCYKISPNRMTLEILLDGFCSGVNLINFIEETDISEDDLKQLKYCRPEDIEDILFLRENGFENIANINAIAEIIHENFPTFNIRDLLNAKTHDTDVILNALENEIEIDTLILLPEKLLHGMSKSSTIVGNLKRDIDFFETYDKSIAEMNARNIYEILENFDLKGKKLKLFGENINKYSYNELDTICEASINYRNIITIMDDSLKEHFKDFDITHFLDIKFNTEQKRKLLSDVKLYKPHDFIYKYVDESYSPNQIKELADALYQKQNIKRACNPNFTIEHMRHVIFYESRNISFENDEDYDKNYIKDKNKDYATFANMYADLDNISYGKHDQVLILIRWLNNLNDAYGMNIDIDKVIHSPMYHLQYDDNFNKLIDFCIKEKIDAGILLTGEYGLAQMNYIAKAIATKKDYSAFLNPKLSIEDLEKMLNDLNKETIDDPER